MGIFFLATLRTSTFSGFQYPQVFSKEKGNQSLPTFRVVFKLSQVPPVEKVRGKKPVLFYYYKHLLQSENLAYSVCVNILTCGGPQPCWRGPLW